MIQRFLQTGFSAILLLVAACGTKPAPDPRPAMGGLELTVVLKGTVKEHMLLRVVGGAGELNLGGLGTYIESDDDILLHYPSSPLKVGEDMVVRYGLDPSNLAEFRFKTDAAAEHQDRIRSARLEYHGKGRWVLYLYEDPASSRDRQPLITLGAG